MIHIALFSTHDRRLPIAFKCLEELFAAEMTHSYELVVYSDKTSLWSTWLAGRGIVVNVGTDYMNRAAHCYNNSSRYTIRVDDDLIIPSKVWKYLLGNGPTILEEHNAFSLAPTFSTSIPGVDFFAKDFLNDNERNELYKMFLKDNIPISPWHGISYQELHDFIKNMKVWDSESYYTEVLRLETPFKAIHPVRFSNDASWFIAKKLVEHKEKFYNPTIMECHYYPKRIHNTHPFMIKTDDWHKAQAYRVDYFDELSQNRFANENGLVDYVIRGGYAMHGCFNYVPDAVKIEEYLAVNLTT